MKGEQTVRINDGIRAKELRVITADGDNLGVLSRADALKEAEQRSLDLIEISPTAKPPVAKIMEYGKYQYDEKKKRKEAKQKSATVETKNIQIKPGTGEHDLSLKAKRISDWLKEGHRVKLDLFLRGRAKYMEKSFLEERMERVLHFVNEEYKIADGPKKSPKGLTVILERSQSK